MIMVASRATVSCRAVLDHLAIASFKQLSGYALGLLMLSLGVAPLLMAMIASYRPSSFVGTALCHLATGVVTFSAY